MPNQFHHKLNISLCLRLVAAFFMLSGSAIAQAQTNLSDAPLFSTSVVPSNVLLTLSVEFPTAVGRSHTTAYSSAATYIGYFDPYKCYTFNATSSDVNRRYFEPMAAASATHTCTGMWSGNFLNWATTPTIDPFRWGLTGGNRLIDEIGLTVLEKAFASNNGGFPDQSISSNVSSVTPYSWSAITVRVANLGKSMRFKGTSTLAADSSVEGTYGAPPASPSSSTTYELPVRVQVCKTNMLEANCTLYGTSSYKPTGLIQQYSEKLRFGAFGYLLDSTLSRDGGVLRARMKSVGPLTPQPGQASVANAAKEWDSDGRLIVNPDTADSAASGVANSGVINYLNKFGSVAKVYKSYDPVGELYYAGIRYLKGLPNVPEYSNLTGTVSNQTTQKDGFPVITDWVGGAGRPYDPVQYACQKNFIIGIGDTNTHADANLPGSTIRSSNEPTLPALVAADTSIDTRLATNKVGQLEGFTGTNLGEVYPSWCCNKNTYLMAGLAYDSHTKDMRPNDFGTSKGNFKTTVDTYWLDVMESGQGGGLGGVLGKNQFWLAAKYGGFAVPDGFDPYARTTALPQAWWNTSGRLDLRGNVSPENYYDASKADVMVAGLKSAFADISAKSGTSSALGLVSLTTTNDNNASFSASFDAGTWTGNVIASTVSFDVTGTPTLAESWQASGKLDTKAANTGWDTARIIATSNATAAASGVAFRYTSITNATFRTALGGNASNVINYLRGDRSNEGTSGTQAYRVRTSLLGDITNSRAVPVGVPAEPYSDTTNAGYSAFKTAKASRQTMVYVGANDGMLHAFNGNLTGTGAGEEAFAYVPSLLYRGPNATPSVDGLLSLGNKSFTHHFFVDASPFVIDIDFDKAGSATGTLPTATPNWRSILVGGLGKGGKGYYALDVTDPTLITTETVLASKVLWEFTHANMGFSYGQPVIVKTAKYGWVCILTSGYNNADGGGYFFILNPKTGALLEPPIPTGVGSASNQSGLAHASGYTLSYGDFFADAVYAGDLLGNVWRLDLTGTTGNYSAPTAIATLTTSSGTAQAVTTRPLIEIDASTFKRYVFIGTGKLLADTDIATSQQQTFYAINDGMQTAFNQAANLPSGVSFPISRSNLNALTDTVAGIGSSPAQSLGYYIDLAVTNNVAERINAPIVANNGIVAFAANYPGGDVCTPSGSNKVYALTYATGQSKVQNVSGGSIAYASGNSLITDLTFVSNRGRVRLMAGNDQKNVSKVNGPFSGTDRALQMNWREIPAVD